jgi:hypothetical protein
MKIFRLMLLLACSSAAEAATTWIPADDTRIARAGSWQWTAHRYAEQRAMVTADEGAALEFEYVGRTAVLVLDTLTPPNNFGPPELGALEVWVDGVRQRTIRPREEDRDVILLRADADLPHSIRIVHRRDEAGTGVRVRGIRVVAEPSGDLAFTLSGQHNGAMVDARAILSRQGLVIRDTLVRNWLTGQCRIAALPPGSDYVLELRAAGWTTWRMENIAIRPEVETQLPPIYLEREWDAPVDEFKFPALGHPIVRRPGESFSARFEAPKAEIRDVRVRRQRGPATISRACHFEENAEKAFYYHREGTVTLPADTPTGLYDLEVTIIDQQGVRKVHSRRSVSVVKAFHADPVFLAFGHLDTWGQYQAEYLSRLAAIANIVAPDLVLVANEANAAYAAGALYSLDVPFVINFGNHRAPEPGTWFADRPGVVDFGTDFGVLNFTQPWDRGIVEANELFGARPNTRIKIVNAFEANAPVHEFLDRHRVALIHYAHGPGPAVAALGATPTMRIGKVNSESFRVIRFRQGLLASYGYRGLQPSPVPFPRDGRSPVRLSFYPANDGTSARMTARLENDLDDAIPAACAVFILPRGAYRVEGATIEQMIDSDDRCYTEVTVRANIPARGEKIVEVFPKPQPR